jgi:large subunit ribosomal protein L25
MVETKKITLSAKTRTITGKKVKTLRSNGAIPAVLYGHDTKPQSLEVNTAEFRKVYDETGTSTLVDLKIDDSNSVKVLTHEPQLNPVTGNPLHVDFYKVRMDEKISTEIPLEFIGESDAVNNEDGALITNRDNIEIECLPNDLIPKYEIDLSALKTFDDQITVADIKLPSTIEILTDPEEVIAFVERPRSDEELAELEESAADEEKEAIEQIAGEEQEGESAEGETSEEEPKEKE